MRTRQADLAILLCGFLVVVATSGQSAEIHDRDPSLQPLLELLGVGADEGLEQIREKIRASKLVVRFLVATLPDPVDPHLADQFDAHLGAIEAAMAERGLLMDRYWIPWIKERAEKAVPDKVADAAVAHARFPGTVLFRGGCPSTPTSTPLCKDLLVLFLVGENPTSGVHREALRKALDYQRAIPQAEQTIRIVGPSFSGSADSIRRALEEYPTAGPAPSVVHIVSGSATNENVQTTLTASSPTLEMTFKATVLPDLLFTAFLDHLEAEFGFPRPLTKLDAFKTKTRIALLRESNTAYGMNIPNGRAPLQGRPADGAPGSGKDRSPQIIELPYPLHISQLLGAYEKARSKEQGDAGAIPSLSKMLQLSFGDDGEPGDVVPAISPITKHSAELALANILAVVSRMRIGLVGIAATDPRDKIFLAGEIKKFSPDVVLFTSEADLLYAHPDLRAQMRGMLVASTYPLFNLNQLWSYPFSFDQPLRQFPTSGAQGVYNATQILLSDLGPGFDAARELAATHLLEYGSPLRSDSTTPALWVSMVGNGGLWPIAAIDCRSPDIDPHDWSRAAEYVYDPSGKVATGILPCPPRLFDREVVYPRSFFQYALAVFLCVLLLWHSWRILWPSKDSAVPGAKTLALMHTCPSELIDPRASAKTFASIQLLGFLSLTALEWAVLVILISGPAAAWRQFPSRASAVLMLALPSACLAAVVLPSLAIVELERRFLRSLAGAGGNVEIVTRLFCHLGGYALLAASISYAVQTLWLRDATFGLFLYVRATNWASGLSPIVPMLALGAAVYLTTWCHLARITTSHEHLADPPLHRVFGLDEAEKILRLENQANAITEGGLLAEDAIVAFFGIYLMTVIVFGIFLYPTVEGHSWSWLMRMAFILVVIATLHALLQFVQCWRRCRGMLRWLVIHPALGTMRDLRDTFASMLGVHPYAQAPRIEQLIVWAQAHLPRIETAYALSPHGGGYIPESTMEAQSPREQAPAPSRAIAWSRSVNTVISYATALDGSRWERDPSNTGWWKDATELVTIAGVISISRYLGQLRMLITVASIDSVLILIALGSYPFQPHGLLRLFLWGLILTVIIASVAIFVDMDRNPVLSYLSGSTPGKVTWDFTFWVHLLVYGALPLIGLLAVQFPEVGQLLYRGLQPFLHATK